MAPITGQLLVRGLDGRTSCLQVPHTALTGLQLKSILEGEVGIPASALRLSAGVFDVSDETLLLADEAGVFPSCSLLLRLVGGKGGFGSLLRGAATKAGQKKTSNFDACRDMSGRRLRHVNAEKQLREWKAEAKDRDLEKAGEDFLKKLAKEKKENESAQLELSRLREQSAQAMENVSSAVVMGLKEAKRQAALGKRKVEEEAEPQKRSKLLAMLEEIDEDEDDEVEEGVGDGEVMNGVELTDGAGPSSVSEDASGKSSSEGEPEAAEPVIGPVSSSEEGTSGRSGSEGSEMVAVIEQVVVTVSPSRGEEGGTAAGSGETEKSSNVFLAGPLKFDDFDNASELEKLGMERLKTELQQRGLKCGGSLSERAARLFLLKHTPVDQMDKKHLAKASNGKKA